MNLKLITTESFNNLPCNFYRNMNDDILLTREQIGQALEYANPSKAIRTIHLKHKDRLEPLCLRIKLAQPQSGANLTKGEEQERVYYTERGIMEICRWSRQKKANLFMDWVWDIVEKYRHNELESPAIQQATTALTNINSTLQSLAAQNQSFNDRLKTVEDTITRKPKSGFSRWTRKMKPKYEALMEYFEISRKKLYHNLFLEFENRYPDIDLNQEVEDYCIEYGFATCYTMDVIASTKSLRELFEKMVDFILAENNISINTETSFTETIFSVTPIAVSAERTISGT